MAKRRIGRPKTPKALKLSKRLQIMVTPSEHEECEKEAEQAGVSLSDWGREALLERLTRRRRGKEDRKEDGAHA